ncbi:MAG: N-acetyltransferase [Clostridiales bacterium]|nr:N-acetyltransferase [Clostridiales bacterium]
MEIKFVEMEEKYLQAVKKIYNYYIENSTATFHYYPMDDDGIRELVFFDRLPYKTYVMISPEDEVCGYVLLTRHKSREAYDITAEVTIYLHPDYTGKGLGTRALQFIEEYAGKTQLHTLVATICGENESSLKLFEKNGWEKCAHYKEVGKKMGRLLDLVAYQKILCSK